MKPTIRRFRPGDAPACHALFRQAVHVGAASRYSAAERQAWAFSPEMPDSWPARLGDQMTWVAETRREVAGFMTLGHDGHIDFAYVAPEFMGTGLADRLYDTLTQAAQSQGLAHLTTEASHLARSFFTRHGWTTQARQSVIRQGVPITNFRMEYALLAEG